MRFIKYADNQVLIANNDKERQIMINRLVQIGKMYGMEINMKKSIVFKISRNSMKLSIEVERITYQQVQRFKYLGSILTEDGMYTQEIRSRIAFAKNVKNSYTYKNLDLKLKK